MEHTLSRVLAVIALFASYGACACEKPEAPVVPSKVDLTLAVLQQLQQQLKDFQLQNATYRSCLDTLPPSPALTRRYNKSVHLEQQLADKLNRHIRKYKLLNF